MQALDEPIAPVAPALLDRSVTTRALTVWIAAVGVYFMAVFNRGSLAVAGLLAERRFSIGASALSTFTMLQLLVYAGMQIPVGLLIDRLGPRRLLMSGLIVMCAAQACFATVTSFGPALAARALLGCGDAMIFISVLRIVASWFPLSRITLVTQLTALCGMAGGIASTWPLGWSLRTFGWTATFCAAAFCCVALLALPLLVIRDRPHDAQLHDPLGASPTSSQSAAAAASAPTPAPAPAQRTPTFATIRAQMRAGWAQPATRQGLWVHFTTGFPGSVFSMLWGFPFLVQAEGLTAAAASALLTLLICAGMACSFLFGRMLGGRPRLQVPLALSVVAVTATCLTIVLLWPGRAPIWALIMLVLAFATNGAGSMIGFDIARTANPPERLGTVSGMVNVGAFVASAITLPAIGWLLDSSGATRSASTGTVLAGYKFAFAFTYVLLAVGTFQIIRLRARLAIVR
jgi:sugar phosphate permease